MHYFLEMNSIISFKMLLGGLVGLLLACSGMAQGDLGYLKQNFYLQDYWMEPFDCDTLPDDEIDSFQDRICANLRLQWADSTLKLYHDSVRAEIVRHKDDTLLAHFDQLQANWRAYRDRHCRVMYGGYVTTTGAVAYMEEMRWITELRIVEMKRLLSLYRWE